MTTLTNAQAAAAVRQIIAIHAARIFNWSLDPFLPAPDWAYSYGPRWWELLHDHVGEESDDDN